MLFVLERCVPQAERDVPFGRDVCFASDVRFAREDAEHITSLCAKGAIHHYGKAITSLRLAATSLFTNSPNYAIINSERRCEYEKSKYFLFDSINLLVLFLSHKVFGIIYRVAAYIRCLQYTFYTDSSYYAYHNSV